MPPDTRADPRDRSSPAAAGCDPLADVVDRSLEEACCRIARLACRAFDAPAAVVSLVDGGRPYVAGDHGLPGTGAWGSTPLSLTLSTHTGAAGEALALRDVSGHRLLADDPLLAEAGFRSFLALPLSAGSETPGTLCVLSREPREWTADDVELLADLADSVNTELRLRGSLRQIRAAETGAEDAAGQAVVSLVDGIDAVVSEREIGTGRFLFVSRKAESLVGYPVEKWTEEADFWLSVLVHPEDRARVEADLRDAAASGGSADLRYRMIRADGKVIWIRDLVRIDSRSPGGGDSPDIVRGVMVDVTEQQETHESLRERLHSEEELRRAELLARKTVETAPQAFLAMDRDGSVLEWNREAERIFGWSPDEALGRPGVELFLPPEQGEPFMRALEAHATDPGEEPAGIVFGGRSLELEGRRRDGSTVPLELGVTSLTLGEHLRFNVFARDLTEERARERERRRRERQLAQAQRLARLGSWEWEPGSPSLHWSDEMHDIHGTDPEGFTPTLASFLDLIHPDDRELVDGVMSAAAETGEEFMFEHRIIRPDGQQRMVLGQGRAKTDEEGRTVALQGTSQDITGRKELEERERDLAAEQAARSEAEAAENRIREILESITDAFFTIDQEWRFTYANAEAERLLERSWSDLDGVDIWEAFPDLDGTRFQEEFERARSEDRPVEFEAYYPSLERWFEVRAYPSERGLSIYFHDVSARRAAQAELRASEARYRFLSDSIPQHVWTARPDGSLDYMNRVMRQFLGADLDELHADLIGLFHPEEIETARELWRSAVEEGIPLELEARLVPRGDGEARWYLIRARPQLSSEGEVLRWFGTNTDIHDQKKLEQDRDAAMEELERVTHILSSEREYLQEQTEELRRTARALRKTNEELDQFAYVASHDLKAPLRGISNLAEWLADDLGDDLDAEIAEYVDLLQGRVRRMENLIDGILEYSRAGRVQHEPEEVDVKALVLEVVDMVSPPDRFEVRVGSYFPIVRTPRIPLEQVLLNLFGNAVKHADSEAPRVTIACSDEGKDFYEFTVSDNGPGIDPSFHDRIWTIFQTLRPRDEIEGTGIGLSVVKRAVEQMGGQVWVESEPGEGATFRFLWPRSDEPPPLPDMDAK